MERHEILDMMGALKLTGMRHAYDEVVAGFQASPARP